MLSAEGKPFIIVKNVIVFLEQKELEEKLNNQRAKSFCFYFLDLHLNGFDLRESKTTFYF